MLNAIKKLGGSAAISELDEEVIKNLNLAEEEIICLSTRVVVPNGCAEPLLRRVRSFERANLKAGLPKYLFCCCNIAGQEDGVTVRGKTDGGQGESGQGFTAILWGW